LNNHERGLDKRKERRIWRCNWRVSREKSRAYFQAKTIFSLKKGRKNSRDARKKKIPPICLFDSETFRERRIISDCNAMNYTQKAFEINFYFSKFNMLWILRVSSTQKSTPFIHSALGLLANIANNSQYTNGRKLCVRCWKNKNMKNGKNK
jgi:hypothetical protein